MYAIVEIGGEQCKVTASAKIRVPKLEQEAGKKIELDRVLLVVDSGKASIGQPVVKKALVKATVLAHDKDKKVMVFKKKRRKDYKVKKGHRQPFTELRIDSIILDGKELKKAGQEKKKASPKKAAPKSAPSKKPASAKKAPSKRTESAGAKTSAKPKTPAAKSKPDTGKKS
jgi:large subunit ribosomal protein L21